MASLLMNKADKMKQRLQKSFSCSSAASTSVVAIDRHRARSMPSKPDNSSSSSSSSSFSSTKLRKKTRTSPASSFRFLLNSSRPDDDGSDDVTLPPLPPPSFIDLFPVTDQQQQIIAESSSLTLDATGAKDDGNKQQQQAVIKRCCSTRSQHQVVVLKVSLHCKGCAGKVKKHISKMEGVTSLDIDIATKKVTVTGDVTPLGVLNCISKVKSAQFWPASFSSPPRASASF